MTDAQMEVKRALEHEEFRQDTHRLVKEYVRKGILKFEPDKDMPVSKIVWITVNGRVVASYNRYLTRGSRFQMINTIAKTIKATEGYYGK